MSPSVDCRQGLRAHVLPGIPEIQLGNRLTNLIRNNSAENNIIRTSGSRLTNFTRIKYADINNSDPGRRTIGNPEEYTGLLIENDDDSWYAGY